MSSNEQIATARSFLARLRTAFDAATLALAQRCSANGRLSGGKLDAEQVALFELAWAAADLLAAEAGVASLRPDSSELDTRLALLFAAEAGTAVLARLDTLHLELGLARDTLRALRDDPGWESLCRSAAGSRALEAAGGAVAASDGEVGQLALDEPHAMAQASFRRFACLLYTSPSPRD